MPSDELNRVLGGGLVTGSMVLIGGEPGIGKSTLVLQNVLSIKSRRILYVSGEESAAQLKMRAERLGRLSENCYIVCETSLETIMDHIDHVKPQLLVVDSIQTIASDTIESSAGSVSQVRECAPGCSATPRHRECLCSSSDTSPRRVASPDRKCLST